MTPRPDDVCHCGHGIESHRRSDTQGCVTLVGTADDPGRCGCTWSPAQIVAAAMKAAKAEAWDEGYATCLGDFDIAARRESRSPNPYREATR